jgi:hypothetical protein
MIHPFVDLIIINHKRSASICVEFLFPSVSIRVHPWLIVRGPGDGDVAGAGRGIGSRCGGFKQIDPLGRRAIAVDTPSTTRAGFGRRVRHPAAEEPLRTPCGCLAGWHDCPGPPDPGGAAGEQQKPWGTGHAVWSPRCVGGLRVVNADDFDRTPTGGWRSWGAGEREQGRRRNTPWWDIPAGPSRPTGPSRARVASRPRRRLRPSSNGPGSDTSFIWGCGSLVGYRKFTQRQRRRENGIQEPREKLVCPIRITGNNRDLSAPLRLCVKGKAGASTTNWILKPQLSSVGKRESRLERLREDEPVSMACRASHGGFPQLGGSSRRSWRARRRSKPSSTSLGADRLTGPARAVRVLPTDAEWSGSLPGRPPGSGRIRALTARGESPIRCGAE